jgi:4-amino-4-deoxy-L-arabinose transferase-like glycosyltransferase
MRTGGWAGWLAVVLLVALALRLPGMGLVPYYDEASFISGTQNFLAGDPGRPYTDFIPHPPLSMVLYGASFLAFGASAYAARLVPLLAGMATIIVSYLLARDLYGRRAAILAAALMSLAFYHVWSSLLVDIDGGILALFAVLSLFSYNRLSTGGGRRWALLLGVSLGLAALTKYTAVLLAPAILAADAAGHRLRNWKPLAAALLLAAAMAAAFPLYCLATSQAGVFLSTISHSNSYVSLASPAAVAVSAAKAVFFGFQYMTPMLPLLAALAVLRKRDEWRGVLVIPALAFLFFYSFVLTGGSKSRYLSILVPPVAILAGSALDWLTERLSFRDAVRIGALSLAFVAPLIVLNSYGTHSNIDFQTASASLVSGNALFWYNGQASSPFAIRVQSFLFFMAVPVLMFALVLLRRGGRIPLMVMVSSCLAFSGFLIFESYAPGIGPNYSETVLEMAGYYRASGGGMDTYALSLSQGFLLEAGIDGYRTLSPFRPEAFDTLKGRLAVIDVQLFDLPDLQSLRSSIYSNCVVERVFESNGYPFGYFFLCGGGR